MPEKTPLKANFTSANNLDSLGEFEASDYVGVDNGGTGTTTHTSGQVLVGNGDQAVASVVRGKLIAGSNKIILNAGTEVSGVVLGQDVTINIVESEIDISKTTGNISLSQLTQEDPSLPSSGYTASADISGDAGTVTNGVTIYEGGVYIS